MYSAHSSSSGAGRTPSFPMQTRETFPGLRSWIYAATAAAFTRLPVTISSALCALIIPWVPALVVWTTVLPRTASAGTVEGELPKSKPSHFFPCRSPMRTYSGRAAFSALASSMLPTG